MSVAPNPDTQGDGSTVTATFSAVTGAPPVSQFPVTITGTASASAGGTVHSVTVPVTVQATYGLRIQGIEITQGIQTFTLPARDPLDPSAPVPYSGVKLISNMPTVVRVYADAPKAPPGGVKGATVQLRAYDAHGHLLAGSPLGTSSAPAVLTDSGSANVTPSERDNASDSYEFDLPMGWMASAASLTATLVPPTPTFGVPPSAVPCADPGCVALRAFTLDGLSSTYPGTTPIDVVELAVSGSAPNPFTAFWWAEHLMPANVFPDYDYGTIDITWIMQGCNTTCAGRGAKNSTALAFVEDFNSNTGAGGPAMIGVTNQDLGVENSDIIGGDGLSSPEPVAVVDANRPVTDVMHEIGHMFGLSHASEECGGGQDDDSDDTGQTGEAWPPDQGGYIDGIGLDIAAGTRPYQVVSGPGRSERSIGLAPGQCAPFSPLDPAPPECGLPNPPQFFDFMDYCTAADPDSDGMLGSTNAWISVRNWDYVATYAACVLAGHTGLGCEVVADKAKDADASNAASQQAQAGYGKDQAALQRARPNHRRGGSPLHSIEGASAGPRLATEASGAGMVRMYGFSIGGKTTIAIVDPTPTRRLLMGTLSPMRLVLQGPDGHVLSTAPLLETTTHIDGVVAPVELLQGAVAERPGVTGMAILEHGKVIAVQRKPRHAPQVKLIAPLGGQHLEGPSPVIVRWKATDPDPVHLIVSVDFSTDNGDTWRTVYLGPNTGRAVIPRGDLTGSTMERARVRVSDQFDQVTVTSRRFTLAPTGPRVTIISPPNAVEVRPGATVLLSAVAFDDAGRALSGSALTWLAGRTVLGTGRQLFATLPTTATSITLRARDDAGRTTQVILAAPEPKPKETAAIGPEEPLVRPGHGFVQANLNLAIGGPNRSPCALGDSPQDIVPSRTAGHRSAPRSR